MQWFKFYGQDYLSDPKMLALTASERSCWITLLSYASVNDNGMITFLSENQLMIQAGIELNSNEWEKTKGVVKKLEKLKMITLDNADDNETIQIKNWKQRQEIKLTGYERVKKYREKKRNDNAMITDDNAGDNAMITSDKNRIEKNRKEEILNTCGAKCAPRDDQDIFNIINAFKIVNPSYAKYFNNATQRGAARRMIKIYGKDKILQMIAILEKTNTLPYFPTVITPAQLEDKWAILIAKIKQKKVEMNNNQPAIIKIR
jgi:hypothetical protein